MFKLIKKIVIVMLLSGMGLVTAYASSQVVFEPGKPIPPSAVQVGAPPIQMQYILHNISNRAASYRLEIASPVSGDEVVYNDTDCTVNTLAVLEPEQFCSLNFTFTPGNAGQYSQTLASLNGTIPLVFNTMINPNPTPGQPVTVTLTGDIASIADYSVSVSMSNTSHIYTNNIVSNGGTQTFADMVAGTYTIAPTSIIIRNDEYDLQQTSPTVIITGTPAQNVTLNYKRVAPKPISAQLTITGDLVTDAPTSSVSVTMTGVSGAPVYNHGDILADGKPHSFTTMLPGQYNATPPSVTVNKVQYNLVSSGPFNIDQTNPNFSLEYDRVPPTGYSVKGWSGTYITMGSIGEGDANTFNTGLLKTRLLPKGIPLAIFRYTSSGGGDSYSMSPPALDGPTQLFVPLAREIEKAYQTQYGVFQQVMPVIVVYTSGASSSTSAMNLDFGLDADYPNNLRWRLADLILIAHYLQNQKDTQHPVPATILLNPDFLGEIHKIETNADWAPFNVNNLNLKLLTALGEAYADAHAVDATVAIPPSYPTQFTDNGSLSDYMNAIGWIIKTTAPDVPFGWMDNVWAGDPAGHRWLHHADELNAHVASETAFLQSLQVYNSNNLFKPDFLAFDKYETDNLDPTAGSNGLNNGYTYNVPAWETYFGFITGINTQLRLPLLLFQTPGGHIQLNNDVDTRGNHGSTAPDYILGDPLLKTDFSNVASYIKSLTFTNPVPDYNFNDSNVIHYLMDQQTNEWQSGHLNQLRTAHVFGVLWGGGSTTSIVGLAADRDDNGWLFTKLTNCFQKNQCNR